MALLPRQQKRVLSVSVVPLNPPLSLFLKPFSPLYVFLRIFLCLCVRARLPVHSHRSNWKSFFNIINEFSFPNAIYRRLQYITLFLYTILIIAVVIAVAWDVLLS